MDDKTNWSEVYKDFADIVKGIQFEDEEEDKLND